MYITDWELRKLKNLVCFSKGSGYSKKDLVYEGNPIILYGNLYTNYSTIINDVRTYTNKKSSSIISTGRDVIVPASGETPEDIARASFVEVPGIIYGGDLNVLTVDTNILYPSYLAFLLSNGKIKTRLSRLAQGKSIVHLHNSDLEKISFLLPTYHEQKRISNILLNLEESITLQQRQLDLYTKLKKGLLQKLFPKDGEKVPEIRLADFTGNWEQHKLGELGKIQSGVGFPETEQGGTSGVPFFKISDMNKKGNEYEMISANNYVSKEQIIRKKWKPIKNVPAIIFAKVGAAIMLNRKRLVLSTFLIDNNIMAYAFDNSWSAGFGKALFDNIYLPKYAQIGALPSYNGMDIKNIEITIPGKQEQIQMNKLFSQLNKIITLQQNKINELRILKKYLLQKLFI